MRGNMEDFQDFQIIDNCLMVRMPEEVDHHRASYICEGADRLLVRENVENVVFVLKIPDLWILRGSELLWDDIARFPASEAMSMRSIRIGRSSVFSGCRDFIKSLRSCRDKRGGAKILSKITEYERNHAKKYEKQWQ